MNNSALDRLRAAVLGVDNFRNAVKALAERERDPGTPLTDDPLDWIAVLDEAFQNLHDTIKDARDRGY